jgi:DNA-binding HxlR family transcriptional regulator
LIQGFPGCSGSNFRSFIRIIEELFALKRLLIEELALEDLIHNELMHVKVAAALAEHDGDDRQEIGSTAMPNSVEPRHATSREERSMSVRGLLASAPPSAPIAAISFSRALGVVADRWVLQILRDSFAGVRRFEQFKACSGAPRATLADRLKGLVARGVLERVRYQNAPPRYEYRLSVQGTGLLGATLLLLGWEQVWMPPGAAGQPLRHKSCGHLMSPELICSLCGQPVTLENTEYETLRMHGRARPPAPLRRRLSSSSRSLIELAENKGDAAEATPPA